MTESSERLPTKFGKAVAEIADHFAALKVPEPNTEDSYNLLASQADTPLLAARAGLIFGDWNALIKRAKVDYFYFEGLRQLIAEIIKSEQELPELGRDWLVSYLEGHHVPPRKKSGRHNSPEYLDYEIFCQVQKLEAQGFKRTGDRSAAKHSALDVVAAAMAQNSHHLCEYEAIRKAYKRGRAVLLQNI